MKVSVFKVIDIYFFFPPFENKTRESHKLSDEQINWVSEVTERVYRLLSDTPPDGASFAQSIRHILKVGMFSFKNKNIVLTFNIILITARRTVEQLEK